MRRVPTLLSTDLAEDWVWQGGAVKALFGVSFPELTITDPRQLIRILRDRRVSDLGLLIQQAVEEKVTFDQEFARRTLFEVLASEHKARKCRTIVSYLTTPLDFVHVRAETSW